MREKIENDYSRINISHFSILQFTGNDKNAKNSYAEHLLFVSLYYVGLSQERSSSKTRMRPPEHVPKTDVWGTKSSKMQ